MLRKCLFYLFMTGFFCGCNKDSTDLNGGSETGGEMTQVCPSKNTQGEVQAPVFVKNLSGQTSWFASPWVEDLDGDGHRELIAAYYDLFVFNDQGELLDRTQDAESRIYAPHVIADLDGDGIVEIVVGRGHEVLAYEWRERHLVLKEGWPADTTTAGQSPEIRGLAAADLDGDGFIEVAVTTTQTQPTEEGGAQVFVFNASGQLYQPEQGHHPAWPRYNALSGEGNDADRNGQGHRGYGCYGLNIGIGNIDEDPYLEILATYDNHHIQAFKYDGVAINASPWFTNRDSEFLNQRLTWGQFIRWADPRVEEDHYHNHVGEWPHPTWTEWLQWTASPPNIADLNGDGKAEVIGVPNIEMHEPYETQAYGIFVLQGNWNHGEKSAQRLPAWEVLPRGEKPISIDGWYPPMGIPAPTIVNIQGDERPEIIVSMNDGFTYAFDANAQRLWRFNHRHGQKIIFASEATVADLNQDGSPEIVLTTYGDPNLSAGYLVILAADGSLLHDIPLPNPGENGNGNGAPAAPTLADLDGDGQLEIFVQTFDHGMDVFTVPGSSENCLLWTTSRGGPLRTGSLLANNKTH